MYVSKGTLDRKTNEIGENHSCFLNRIDFEEWIWE